MEIPNNSHTELRDMQSAVKTAQESSQHTIHKISQRVYIECSCGFTGDALVQVYPEKKEVVCPNCGTQELNDTGKPVTNLKKKEGN